MAEITAERPMVIDTFFLAAQFGGKVYFIAYLLFQENGVNSFQGVRMLGQSIKEEKEFTSHIHQT